MEPPFRYDYKNREQIDKYLVCSICKEPAVEPVEPACCHVLCAHHLKDVETCSICGEQLADHHGPPTHKPKSKLACLVNDLVVYCPNKKAGCSLSEDLLRMNLDTHLRKECSHCPCRFVERNCPFRGTFDDAACHADTDCGFADVSCPHSCGATIMRLDLAAHSTDCSVQVELREEAAREQAERAAQAVRAQVAQQAVTERTLLDLLNPSADDVVLINAGTVLHMTARRTLLQYPTSRLGVLFGSDRPVEMHHDAVFLDVDGVVFGQILRWLRGGGDAADLGDLTPTERWRLRRQARQWSLEALEQCLAEFDDEDVTPPTRKQPTHRQPKLAPTATVNEQGDAPVAADITDQDGSPVPVEESEAEQRPAPARVPRVNMAGADLSEADLSSKDLTEADLSNCKLSARTILPKELHGVNFSHAILRGQDFRQSVLRDAKFVGADLRTTLIRGADLSFANLTGCDISNSEVHGDDETEGTNFSHAILEGTTLPVFMRKVNLSFTNLAGWDFGSTDLMGSNMEGCILTSTTILPTSLQRVRFAGTELSKFDFSERDLTGTLFDLAILVGANLSRCTISSDTTLPLNLEGIKLDGTNLTDRNLSLSKLNGASLCGATFSPKTLLPMALQGANLSQTDLSDKDLSKANLVGGILIQVTLNAGTVLPKNLTGVDLSQTDLSSRDLTGFTLTGCILAKTVLKGAKLNKAVLRGAKCQGANMSSAECHQADCWEAKFENAILSHVQFYKADLTSAVFMGATLNKATFVEAVLTNAKFAGVRLREAEFTDVDFSETDLTSVSFDGATLTRVVFGATMPTHATLKGSILVDVDLSGREDLAGQDFSQVKLTNVSFEGSDLSRVRFCNATLTNPVLTDAKLIGANLSGCDLRTVDLRRANLTDALVANVQGLQAGFNGSLLLEQYNHQAKLLEWAARPQSAWQCIYRASLCGGFKVSDFVKYCNGKSPTFVVVSANGCLFGGYATAAWVCDGGWLEAAGCFIFSLVNKENVAPTCYRRGRITEALLLNASDVYFGSSSDLRFSNTPSSNAALPVDGSYSRTNPQDPYFQFAGAAGYTITEMEVFALA